MNPRGGTEILWSGLQRWVDRSYLSRVNIILSNCDRNSLASDRPNILWQHVDTDQRVAQGMADPQFIRGLACIVFVSEWQMKKYCQQFSLPRDKCVVLRNAIDPIQWQERKRSSKLKLIYTSTPWRGLEVLLESFKLLNRNDIELDVYSSTVIYGANFMPNAYEWLFNKCRLTPGVNYRGYAANKAVIRSAQSANIFSYPSVFAETSCLAAIEAGAAGCLLATTDLGALPETCGDWATYTSHGMENLVERYTNLLSSAIDNYWNNYGKLEQQSKYFNDRYSWENRRVEWSNLIRQICEG